MGGGLSHVSPGHFGLPHRDNTGHQFDRQWMVGDEHDAALRVFEAQGIKLGRKFWNDGP